MIAIDITKSLHGAHGPMELAIKLEIQEGEFVALMGESGAGKTTLLRVLAGLETFHGDIVVEGVSWQGMAIQKRDIGFVFQDYALFTHMSVEENLLYVKHDKKLAAELLAMTSLSALKDHNVARLSGGQKQRVALCRAMMKKPKVLLMDEPLSALDMQMKKKLQEEIRILQQRFGMTTIMVSHAIEDVYALSSRIIVLSKGKIIEDYPHTKLLSQTDTFSTSVLDIRIKKDKKFAVVSIGNRLLEIEVSTQIEVGDMLHLKYFA